MDGTNPKISFIPKESLVREASFLERSRPQSMVGILAIALFVVSVGSYSGFYFYNKNFKAGILSLTDKITAAQQAFSSAPQVGKAQLFSSRVSVAKELLDSHVVVSPALAFLSQSTLSSILYDKFSFEYKAGGSIVKLSGEAPTYAALAYQADVFRGKKELHDFTISNVVLTKFGTVSFELALTFTPEHLSYTRSLSSGDAETPAVAPTPSSDVSTTTKKDTSTISTPPVSFPQTIEGPAVATTSVETSSNASLPVSLPVNIVTEVAATGTPSKPSTMQSVWSWFKFW